MPSQSATSSPCSSRGLKRLEYRGYDSAGLAVVQQNRDARAAPHGRQGRAARGQAVGAAARGAARRRAHALGHARRRHRSERASASVGRSRRRHPQRHHRELRAAQGRADRQGLRVQVRDRHRGRGAPHPRLSEAGPRLARGAAARRRSASSARTRCSCSTRKDPERIVVTRIASPLVIGLGIGENFVASGVPALLPVTQRFIYLEQGDVAEITRDAVRIFDAQGQPVTRAVHETQWNHGGGREGAVPALHAEGDLRAAERARRHALRARRRTSASCPSRWARAPPSCCRRCRTVHIVACGTSYHAGSVGRYWLESIAGVPCQVEIASEYRYRNVVVPPNTLFVTLSQSGETADTLEALRMAKTAGYLGTLTICNSPHSSMVRESDLVMMTQAGPEIGVASTKAFTTQLLVAAARDADARPAPRHVGGARGRARAASLSRRRGRRASARDERPRCACSPRTSPRSSTRCSWGAARCGRSRWKAR